MICFTVGLGATGGNTSAAAAVSAAFCPFLPLLPPFPSLDAAEAWLGAGAGAFTLPFFTMLYRDADVPLTEAGSSRLFSFGLESRLLACESDGKLKTNAAMVNAQQKTNKQTAK
jgi:hypothetical protein